MATRPIGSQKDAPSILPRSDLLSPAPSAMRITGVARQKIPRLKLELEPGEEAMEAAPQTVSQLKRQREPAEEEIGTHSSRKKRRVEEGLEKIAKARALMEEANK